MSHVKVLHWGNCRTHFEVRDVPGCIAAPGLAMEFGGFVAHFLSEHATLVMARKAPLGSAVASQSLHEAAAKVGADGESLASGLRLVQPRLRAMCGKGREEERVVWSSGKGSSQCAVLSWGDFEKPFLAGKLWLFAGLLVRKELGGRVCYIRFRGPDQVCAWLVEQGLEAEPRTAETSFGAAMQKLGVENAKLGPLLLQMRPFTDKKMNELQGVFEIKQEDAKAEKKRPEKNDKEDEGDEEGEKDKDVAVVEKNQLKNGKDVGASGRVADSARSVQQKPSVPVPSAALPAPASSAATAVVVEDERVPVFSVKVAGVDVLDWGKGPVFRVESKRSAPVLWRVGMVVVKKASRSRITPTWSYMTVACDGVEQFRIWLDSVPESKEYEPLARGMTKRIGSQITKTLLDRVCEVLKTHYPLECEAALKADPMPAPSTGKDNDGGGDGDGDGDENCDDDVIIVDKNRKRGRPEIEIGGPSPVSSNLEGTLAVIEWGERPFRRHDMVYSHGLFVRYWNEVIGWVWMRCSGPGQMRAWCEGSPEPSDKHPRLQAALNSDPEVARVPGMKKGMKKELKLQISTKFHLEEGDDGLGGTVPTGSTDSVSGLKKSKSDSVTDFSVAEDEALIRVLQEGCISGQTGFSMLVSVGEEPTFPSSFIGHMVRERGYLHETIRNRSVEALTKRFRQLAAVIKSETLKQSAAGVRSGQIEDFSFLKVLPRRPADPPSKSKM